MISVLGASLPFALGIAISPVPLIAAILILLSPRARASGIGYLLGCLIGIALAVTVFTLLSAFIPEQDTGAAQPIRGVIHIVLGILLLLLAVRQWRKRPKAGETAELPKWMRAIDSVTFPRAFGFGFVLSAVNPKNLLLAAAAGLGIGSAGLTPGEIAASIAIFTVLATGIVVVLVLGFLIAADRLRAPLDALRDWLAKENAVIMAVLLLVIGIVLIGKGIAAW